MLRYLWNPHVPQELEKRKIVADVLEFVRFTNEFRKIERTLWYSGMDARERNGDHSFQLALVSMFTAQRLRLPVNELLVIWYSIVHDLVERYAKDTPAFRDPRAQMVVDRADKKEREDAAMARIREEWQIRFPIMCERMLIYHLQADYESKYVRGMDKIVVMLNVYEDGGRTWRTLGVTLEKAIEYNGENLGDCPDLPELFDEIAALLRQAKEANPTAYL